MGGNSGGGGGSGAVSYPGYMEDIHEDWLDDSGGDSISESMTSVMDAAIGNSPWTGQAAYDPDTDITAMLAAGTTMQTLVTLLSTGTTLDDLIANVLDEDRLDDAVDEFAADLDARLTAEVVPRFERGMQDINAVVSSAFVIGRALIEENQDRQVAKYSADLHMKAFSDDSIRVIQLKLEYQRAASSIIAELYRMKTAIKSDETKLNIDIDDKDARWDLEVFQYGGNLMASIGGGTGNTKSAGVSQTQSAVGGALSGAAAGAMIGSAFPGYGTAIGAGVGAVLGAASAFL
jgi:hypothetical protein